MTYAREQDLKCQGEQQCCSVSYTIEIQEEDYMKVEERQGVYSRVVQITCSVQGSEKRHFRGVLAQVHRNKGLH